VAWHSTCWLGPPPALPRLPPHPALHLPTTPTYLPPRPIPTRSTALHPMPPPSHLLPRPPSALPSHFSTCTIPVGARGVICRRTGHRAPHDGQQGIATGQADGHVPAYLLSSPLLSLPPSRPFSPSPSRLVLPPRTTCYHLPASPATSAFSPSPFCLTCPSTIPVAISPAYQPCIHYELPAASHCLLPLQQKEEGGEERDRRVGKRRGRNGDVGEGGQKAGENQMDRRFSLAHTPVFDVCAPHAPVRATRAPSATGWGHRCRHRYLRDGRMRGRTCRRRQPAAPVVEGAGDKGNGRTYFAVSMRGVVRWRL